MLKAELFIGFPVTFECASALDQVAPEMRQLFIQHESGEYLQEVVYGETRYLAKSVGETADVAALPLLERNIYSLLHRLIPDYPFEATPLVLFSLLLPDSSSP